MINAINNVKNTANSFNQQVLKIIEMNAANPQDLRINLIRLSYYFGKKKGRSGSGASGKTRLPEEVAPCQV